jgi:hypothetical protein
MTEEAKKLGRQKAAAWLNKQLQKYGNTYHFPFNVQEQLNKKIEKYGNTFFWR